MVTSWRYHWIWWLSGAIPALLFNRMVILDWRQWVSVATHAVAIAVWPYFSTQFVRSVPCCLSKCVNWFIRNRSEYVSRVANPCGWENIIIFTRLFERAHCFGLFAEPKKIARIFLFVSISFVSIGAQIIVQIEIDLTNTRCPPLLLLDFPVTHTVCLLLLTFLAQIGTIFIEPLGFCVCLLELRLWIAYFII